MLAAPTMTFGILLKQLRKRAGMTQRDLAAALGYSDSLISSLEKEQRLPDLTLVVERLVPALGLQEEPIPGCPCRPPRCWGVSRRSTICASVCWATRGGC